MDVVYVVDYDPNSYFGQLGLDSLGELVRKVSDIFATAGLYATCLDTNPVYDTLGGWSFADVHDERALLAYLSDEHRERPRGRGRGALHVIVGGSEASCPLALAHTIDFSPSPDWGADTTNIIDAMHMASSGFRWNTQMENACLDSCGIFLFDNNAFRPHGGSQHLWGTDYGALALAHELGHALGLVHLDSRYRGVMTESLNLMNTYSYYSRFIAPFPDERRQHSVVNLREVLGREAVSIWRSRLYSSQ
jgi:hypothetical protein